MEYVRLGVALFLPWIMGGVCVYAIGKSRRNVNIGLLLGYGYFIGVLVTTLMLRLWDMLGVDQSFWAQAGLLAIMSVAGSVYAYIRKQEGTSDHINMRRKTIGNSWKKALWFLFLLLILIRCYFLFQEIIERPLYPWDAWWHWVVKAKIWLEWNELVPIVKPDSWLVSDDIKTYTLDGYYKPITVSLISYWYASSLGYWNDVLINIPWFFCGVAFVLAFYGQLRMWGIQPLPTMIFSYILLSLPYINTHMALAGYADIWVSAAYLLTAMSFLQWIRTKESTHAALTLLMIVFLILVKLPGIVWAFTFVPAVLVVYLSRIQLFLLLFVSVFIAWLALLGKFTFSLPVIGNIEFQNNVLTIGSAVSAALSFHNVSGPFINTALFFGNWHLLLILVVVGILAYLMNGKDDKSRRAAMALIFSFASIMFFLFFYTDWFAWAKDQTTINRMILHGVPMAFFSIIILLWPLRKQDSN